MKDIHLQKPTSMKGFPNFTLQWKAGDRTPFNKGKSVYGLFE